MSEEDLELLITLDDPVDPPEEDIFNHMKATDLESFPGSLTTQWCGVLGATP